MVSVIVSMPHAALLVVQRYPDDDDMYVGDVVSMPHAALLVVQRQKS